MSNSISNDFVDPNNSIGPNGPIIESSTDIFIIENLGTTIEKLKMEMDILRHNTMTDEKLVHKILQMKINLEGKLQQLDSINIQLKNQIDCIMLKLGEHNEKNNGDDAIIKLEFELQSINS